MRNLFFAYTVITTSIISVVACTRGGEQPETGQADLSGVPVGQIRGAVAISDALRTRLLDDSDPQTASFAVERLAGSAVFGLKRQLGVFTSAGTQTEFQGGTPTPFNMALWHQLFARFADGTGNVCASGGVDVTFVAYTNQRETNDDDFSFGTRDAGAPGKTFKFFPTIATKVADVCAFKGDEAARKTAAGALFDSVMGRGGSLSDERNAFLTKFAADGSPFVTAAPKERVSSMLVAMLLNPHFLLTK